MAKHGNRSVSSSSGSADVLEQLGVRIDLTPEQVAATIEQVGIGFLFAPAHHGAMKYAIGPRRELGARTIFNLLGPLTNPAAAPCQVIGVYDAELVEPVAQVLKQLGSDHVLVVRGDDGLDEISLSAPTQVAELKDGAVESYTLTAESMQLPPVALADLVVNSAQQSVEVIRSVLAGQSGPARHVVLANAGAAIYVAGLAADLSSGIAKAAQVIDSGKAAEKLADLVAATQSFPAAD